MRRELDPLLESRSSEHGIALIVAGVFLAAGIVWVLFTDILLYRVTNDAILVARIETAKGWMFVMLATALLYLVTLLAARRLVRARAAISTVVESIADGVLLLGPDRTIQHANPAAKSMLRCDDLAGMGAEEFSRRFRVSYPNGALVPPQDLISQRVFDEGGPLHYKAVLHLRDAPDVVISATAAAVRDEVRAPARLVVSVMHDITVSERLESLRDQFFAAAAHALKTPTAIIKANVQAMAGGGSERVERSTAAIERQCCRIDQLVQNLLILARVRSGTLKLQQRLVAVGPLVEQTTRRLVRVLGYDVVFDIGASPRVYGDRDRLALALGNLIEGAARSSVQDLPIAVLVRTSERFAEIGVSCRPLLSLEERMAVAVTRPEYDELGIGRLVVETIAEAHGGSVREEGGSSEETRWLCLPITDAS